MADENAGHITVKGLIGTSGVRVLIADRSEDAAGAGAGQWRVAVKKRPPSWAMQDREPGGVHAATVERVERVSGTPDRYNVVTNLGTVEGLTAGQRLRPAPADMRDMADILAEIAADQQQKEERRAQRWGVDGTPVAPGDLVELIDQGGDGRAGRPGAVVRVIRLCLMGIVVARPYARAYGDTYGVGEGLAISDGFRRLPDQTQDGPNARRSCGCPATIRDQIIPPPADGNSDGWRAAVWHQDRMAARDRRHNPGCRWGDPTDNATDVLYTLAYDLERAGEDVHAAKARRLGYYLNAGDTNLTDVLDTLHGMPCPQHIRGRIEQAAAEIAPTVVSEPEQAPELVWSPNHWGSAVHAPQCRDRFPVVRPGDTPPAVVMPGPATRAAIDEASKPWAPSPEPRMYGAGDMPRASDMLWASPWLTPPGTFQSGWGLMVLTHDMNGPVDA